jgi:hypothetical protein
MRPRVRRPSDVAPAAIRALRLLAELPPALAFAGYLGDQVPWLPAAWQGLPVFEVRPRGRREGWRKAG